MSEVELDKALSEFLNDDICTKADEFVFELIRAAFTAGWKAALELDSGKNVNIDKRK